MRGALQKLDLWGCSGLSGAIPKSLGQCTALQALNLFQCGGLSGAIPESLGPCTALQALNLRLCLGLSGEGGTIPESLRKVPQLSLTI